MLELWHLMDTPIEEQQKFLSVTCNIAASEHEIAEPNALSIGFINNVSALFHTIVIPCVYLVAVIIQS